MRRFVRDILWVAGSNYFTLLAGLPLGLVTPLFLNPAAYAILAVIDYITEMLKHYPLGSHFSVMREIPLLRAAGDEQGVADVRDTVWTITLLGAIPVLLVPAALARWGYHRDGEFQLCLFLGCIGTVAWTLGSVFQSVMKGEKRFKTDSVLTMVVALLPIPTLLLCLWLLGVVGYFLSNAIVGICCAAIYARILGTGFRLRMPGVALKTVLAIGLPTFIVGLVDSAYGAIGRVMLKPIVTAELLGLYFFALKFNRYFLGLPQAVGRVYLPNLMSKLGRVSDERELASSVTIPALFMGHAMAVLISVAAVLVPELVRVAYPKFAASAEAMSILFIGAYWPAVGMICWKHLLGTNRWKSAISGYVLGIGLIAAGMWLWRDRMTLTAAAGITASGVAVCNLVSIVQSFCAISSRAADVPIRLAKLSIPFLLLVVGHYGIREAWMRFNSTGLHPIVGALVKASVLALAWLPVLWLFWRRHGSFLKVPPPVGGEESSPAGQEPGPPVSP
ncbi:MAG: oligosaccharide flippase family protein [Planctomycetes bacterium]|nr:oligosaccharide flippase family protein [Planctomycetota bacterium]